MIKKGCHVQILYGLVCVEKCLREQCCATGLGYILLLVFVLNFN
jgi:hypothetical protein